MNDNFLYQLNEEPDSEFTKKLHQRLFNYDVQTSDRKSNINFQRLLATRKAQLGWITVAVAISLLLLTTISPVRAFVSSFIANIAGQVFEMTDDYPGDNNLGDEIMIEPQVLSLADALATFPHKVYLPTYIPSGYILNENVRVYIGEDTGYIPDTIEITWLAEDSGIILIITNRDWSVGEIVAPNSVEEISLDANHPAVVIRGGWDADEKIWTAAHGTIRLRWLAGEITYELMGTDLEQLIEIALSTLD